MVAVVVVLVVTVLDVTVVAVAVVVVAVVVVAVVAVVESQASNLDCAAPRSSAASACMRAVKSSIVAFAIAFTRRSFGHLR